MKEKLRYVKRLSAYAPIVVHIEVMRVEWHNIKASANIMCTVPCGKGPEQMCRQLVPNLGHGCAIPLQTWMHKVRVRGTDA